MPLKGLFDQFQRFFSNVPLHLLDSETRMDKNIIADYNFLRQKHKVDVTPRAVDIDRRDKIVDSYDL